MAVYTEVDDDALVDFLAQYDIGQLIACKGIAEGVENSNYLLQTETGLYFLTIYEKRVDPADLPFFLGLLDHLASGGVNCPPPIHGRDGLALRQLMEKPAALHTFMNGISPKRPTSAHCIGVGKALAQMHLVGRDYPLQRKNALSIDGWPTLIEQTAARADIVDDGLATFVAAEFNYLQKSWPNDLPAGVIHADAFPDNVLFMGEELSGLIDFYFACNDAFAYDLAICLNAWCFEPNGEFNITKARRLMLSYDAVRKIEAAEYEKLPLLARGAALRFLLTRLYDWLNQVEGALVKPKDPMEYVKKLRFHQRIDSASAYGLDPGKQA